LEVNSLVLKLQGETNKWKECEKQSYMVIVLKGLCLAETGLTDSQKCPAMSVKSKKFNTSPASHLD